MTETPAPLDGKPRLKHVAVMFLVLAIIFVASSVSARADAAPTPSASAQPATSPVPCTNEDCIPQPGNQTPTATPSSPSQQTAPNGSDCTIWDPTTWGSCVSDMFTEFFRGVVRSALNPLLGLLGATLLATPSLDSVPRITELWNGSLQIMLACYGILVMIGGILVMTHHSLHTRYAIKEILPRITAGFLAGALSLFIASKAITIANALVGAIMGEGVNVNTAGDALKAMFGDALNSFGIVEILLALAFIIGLVAILLTYIVRVAFTVMLIASAPLFLMGHALPHTEGIARWWWKAIGACLAIQLTQSLALVTAIRVLLSPGFTILGPSTDGLVNLLMGLALVYILVKIPFWLLGSIRGTGRSFVGGLARAMLMGKALALINGRRHHHVTQPGRSQTRSTRTLSGPADPPWPAPIRAWEGIDGIYSAEAIGRRLTALHRHYAETKRPPSRVRPPFFLQPPAQFATIDGLTMHTTEPPTKTAFQQPVPTPAENAVAVNHSMGPAPKIQFRTATTATPKSRNQTSPSAPPVPVHLQFQAPTAEAPPPRPHHASTAPLTPTFQGTSQPEPMARRARAHNHPPLRFQNANNVPPEPNPGGPTPPSPRRRTRRKKGSS